MAKKKIKEPEVYSGVVHPAVDTTPKKKPESRFKLNDKGLVDSIPDVFLSRADAIQYWLQQKDYPNPGTEGYKKLSVMDKMVIGMIIKATDDGNATAFNALFEQGFGRNTEGMDTSKKSENAGAMFNIPMTLQELEEKKKKENDKGVQNKI